MPTFKLVRRPRHGTGAARGERARDAAVAAEAAVPDTVASATTVAATDFAVPPTAVRADPAVSSEDVATCILPTVSAQPHADAEAKAMKRHKDYSAEEVTASKKKSTAHILTWQALTRLHPVPRTALPE